MQIKIMKCYKCKKELSDIGEIYWIEGRFPEAEEDFCDECYIDWGNKISSTFKEWFKSEKNEDLKCELK